MDFQRLGEVDTISEIRDTDTVMIVRDGEIYQVDKNLVGGNGNYVLELNQGDIVIVNNILTVTKNIDDMLTAYNACIPISFKINMYDLISVDMTIISNPVYISTDPAYCYDYDCVAVITYPAANQLVNNCWYARLICFTNATSE